MTAPEAKFLNMGLWVADPKGKNIPTISCLRRTEVSYMNGGTGAHRIKGTFSRKSIAKFQM